MTREDLLHYGTVLTDDSIDVAKDTIHHRIRTISYNGDIYHMHESNGQVVSITNLNKKIDINKKICIEVNGLNVSELLQICQLNGIGMDTKVSAMGADVKYVWFEKDYIVLDETKPD